MSRVGSMLGPWIGLLMSMSFSIVVAADLGRQDFQLHCMGCHGEAGEGMEGKVPSLRANLARLLAESEGRAYVLRVPGVAQSSLSSQRLAAVLNWLVREYASSADTLSPFTAAEVEDARKEPLLDVGAQRQRMDANYQLQIFEGGK